jgi:hypothetical protein
MAPLGDAGTHHMDGVTVSALWFNMDHTKKIKQTDKRTQRHTAMKAPIKDI